jgi:hypothetical protein
MVGHVGAHQVDEGKDGLVWADAGAVDQQVGGIVQGFAGVALKTKGGLPQGHHQGGKRQGQQGIGAGKGILNSVQHPGDLTLKPLTVAPHQARTNARLVGLRGEQAAVVEKAVEAPPQPVVDYPHQGIVAKPGGVVPAGLQSFRQGGQVGRQHRIGLHHGVL